MHFLFCLSLLPECDDFDQRSEIKALDIFLSILFLEYERDKPEGGKNLDFAG